LTIGRVVATATVVFLCGFWVWAFSPWAPDDNPDRLEDRAFAEAAEARCAATLDRIDAIPSAREADTPAERADQVEAGTLEVETLVADLGELATQVEIPAERELIADWFVDWDHYIADRWSHVETLRDADSATSDRDLAFVLNPSPDGDVYTERLDGFARVNGMDSCVIPGDV
jgi:hypothetical protein